MSHTLEDIRRGVQRKLAGETPWGDIYTTASANITSATVVDLTGFKTSLLSDNHYRGWYFYVCDNTAGSDGTPPGNWRRIASSDSSAGQVTVDNDLTKTGTNYLDSGCEIEVVPYHPKFVEQCINDFLTQVYYPTEWAISLLNIENNDFEHGTISTGWTTNNASLAAETTEVFRQTQSGKVTANAAGGYITASAFAAIGQEQFRIYAACKVTAGDSGNLLITDSAAETLVDIDAEETRWQILSDEFQVSSTAEYFTLYLSSVANTDIIYWDDVQLISGRRTEYKLPSWITEEFQIRDVLIHRGAGQLADEPYNYMPDESKPYPKNYWQPHRDGAVFKIRLDPRFGAGRPFLACLRPYASLAAPSATTPTGGSTDCDLNYAIQGGFVTALERLAARSEGEDRDKYLDWWSREKPKLDRMTADYQPWVREPKRDIQDEGWFSLSEAS